MTSVPPIGPTLVNLDLNLMAFYDLEGALLWGQLLESGETADLAGLGVFEEGSPRTAQLISHSSIDAEISGLIQTNMGPMLISSMPILQTGEVGPIGGTLVMARFLDESRVWRLSEQTEVDFSAVSVADVEVDYRRPLVALSNREGDTVYHETTERSIFSYGLLRDVFGDPIIILEARTPKEISALGRQTVNGTLLFLSLAGIITAVVAWVMLRKVVVGPLEGLARHIVGIRQSGDLSQRLNEPRSDEIGAVASRMIIGSPNTSRSSP